jgi:hypothetical protein
VLVGSASSGSEFSFCFAVILEGTEMRILSWVFKERILHLAEVGN